jgi:hypothetical protein
MVIDYVTFHASQNLNKTAHDVKGRSLAGWAGIFSSRDLPRECWISVCRNKKIVLLTKRWSAAYIGS